MNLTAFSHLANNSPEVDKNQKMELTIGSLSFMMEVIPGGAYRLQVKKTGKDESNPWNAEQLRWFYA
jgi:hypothetical protein